jgi:peptide/nickel transport system substrate-binding protein
MMRIGIGGLLAAFGAFLATAMPAAAARDELTIGVSQFPSSLHPYIDPEVVKGYILGFTLRPVTAFDSTWHNHCMMCTELPTLENGMVKLETRANGAPGMAIALTLRPDLVWGDGTPVTTADLAVTARIGGNPASGFPNTRTWGRVERVEIIDAQHAVLHLDEVWSLYDRIPSLLSAKIEGAVYDQAGGEAGGYMRQTVYNRAPTAAGLFNGPYRIAQYQSSVQVVLERNPAWRGPAPQFRRIPGTGAARAAARPVRLCLPADALLHPYRHAARQSHPRRCPRAAGLADGDRPQDHRGSRLWRQGEHRQCLGAAAGPDACG